MKVEVDTVKMNLSTKGEEENEMVANVMETRPRN